MSIWNIYMCIPYVHMYNCWFNFTKGIVLIFYLSRVILFSSLAPLLLSRIIYTLIFLFKFVLFFSWYFILLLFLFWLTVAFHLPSVFWITPLNSFTLTPCMHGRNAIWCTHNIYCKHMYICISAIHTYLYVFNIPGRFTLVTWSQCFRWRTISDSNLCVYKCKPVFAQLSFICLVAISF